MNFSIIGTGNMAWFLIKRLGTSGHHCIGIYGRDREAASKMAEEVNTKCITDLADIGTEADVCFLAVADNAIPEIAQQLSLKHATLIHTAGALGPEVLSKAAKNTAVLWPVYSILRNAMPAHRDIPCAWEATTPHAMQVVTEMAHAFSNNVFEANTSQRQWLHLTAVFTNNFINHLMTIGEEICTEQQLPYSAIQPILNQTFIRAQNHRPYDIQTGPARRGDMETIHKHLNLLEAHPELQDIYQVMTNSIINMYLQSHTEKKMNS